MGELIAIPKEEVLPENIFQTDGSPLVVALSMEEPGHVLINNVHYVIHELGRVSTGDVIYQTTEHGIPEGVGSVSPHNIGDFCFVGFFHNPAEEQN